MQHQVDNNEQYLSTVGLSTKKFGPIYWNTLFTMVMGAYPPTLNPRLDSHKKIRKAFIQTFSNLRYTLPCIFCQRSYAKFYRKIPIKQFTGSRIDMMFWLYLMKDQVNQKLIKQEDSFLEKNLKDFRKNKITRSVYNANIKQCFKTKPSPPFEEVLEHYETFRASSCHKTIKKCI